MKQEHRRRSKGVKQKRRGGGEGEGAGRGGVGVDFMNNNVDPFYYSTTHMLPIPLSTLLPNQCPGSAETVLRQLKQY